MCHMNENKTEITNADVINAKAINVPAMSEVAPEDSSHETVASAAIEAAVVDNPSDTPTVPVISNAEFIKALYHSVPDGAHIAVCGKSGDPTQGGWSAKVFTPDTPFDAAKNNYLNAASYTLNAEGHLAAKKENFAALHFLILDDVGTKIPEEHLDGLRPSAKSETSPGNYQVFLILEEPITDIEVATRLQKRLIEAGLCDPGASGVCRWGRLPVGINGKPQYRQDDGQTFQCRLEEWNPDVRYTLDALEAILTTKITPKALSVGRNNSVVSEEKPSNHVFTPKSEINPVLKVLMERGLYKRALGNGGHDITCPRVHEHTGGIDNGAAYFEPSEKNAIGGFRCHHSHGEDYRIGNLLRDLGLDPLDALHKPQIRIHQGELHTMVDAVCQVLADDDTLYQMGGVLVQTKHDQESINIQVMNQSMLMLTVSQLMLFSKYDGRSKKWVRSDPPSRVVTSVYDAKELNHVKTLNGIARQPYYREDNGELVRTAGFNAQTGIYGDFKSENFDLPEPTLENAQAALGQILELLSEFEFAAEVDKAAAVSMLLTAVTRPSLNFAPGYLAKAPMSGSGKSYLCLIAWGLATPESRQPSSYPKTAEEASKTLLSLLLQMPPVIEFDDMDEDIKPHSIMKQVLTSEFVTNRILGQSKTATVSTRTLFMFSGNNVDPVRDLRRRIITINLQRTEENPITVVYQNNPVDVVKKNRARIIVHILTIIEAWKHAGCPRTSPLNIVTYDGAWSDYCRHPLVWLGLSDPAEALIEQVTHDPDLEILGDLLTAWYDVHKSACVTLRRVTADLTQHMVLGDALHECPVHDQRGINNCKLGWFLRKNENRIVDGLMFVQGRADGRNGWQVKVVDAAKAANKASNATDYEVSLY